MSQFQLAEYLVNAGITDAQRHGEVDRSARLENYRGGVLVRRGQLNAAVDSFQRSQVAAGVAQEPQLVASASLNEVFSNIGRGDIASAKRFLRKCIGH